MVVCPKCGTNIDADFGIQRCPNCSTNVIIELDGSARIEEIMDGGAMSVAPDFMAPTAQVESLEPEPMAIFSDAPAESESSAPALHEMPSLPPTPDPPAVILKPRQPPKNDGDLSVIADFGNSDASMARDGLYIYDLLIWNVDSRDTKEHLREALTDARFAWDVEKIMAGIQQGALRISSINAVKSALLVNRIKNLPIGISWEQKLVTDLGGA